MCNDSVPCGGNRSDLYIATVPNSVNVPIERLTSEKAAELMMQETAYSASDHKVLCERRVVIDSSNKDILKTTLFTMHTHI